MALPLYLHWPHQVAGGDIVPRRGCLEPSRSPVRCRLFSGLGGAHAASHGRCMPGRRGVAMAPTVERTPCAGGTMRSAIQAGGTFLGALVEHPRISFRSPFHLAGLAAIRSIADAVAGDGLEDVVAEGWQIVGRGAQQ